MRPRQLVRRLVFGTVLLVVVATPLLFLTFGSKHRRMETSRAMVLHDVVGFVNAFIGSEQAERWNQRKMDQLREKAIQDAVKSGRVLKLSYTTDLSFSNLVKAVSVFEQTNRTEVLFTDARHLPRFDVYVWREDERAAKAFLGGISKVQ